MATSGDLESTRPLAQFPPTVLGDHVFSAHADDSKFDAIEHEIESVMKPYVRDRLVSSRSCDKEKIRLIHLLISLAISHYFEEEIEEILNQAFGKLEGLIAEEDDLETISIMFEVFRLYGHKMSCDVFERFKGEHDGKFKESLVGDVRGMLQLYEASHLKTTNEDIMEEAQIFTRNHLAAVTTNHPHLYKHVQNTLFIPRYHCIEIVVAREYISFYEQEEDHEEKLLKFAKLNFSYCQLHYVQGIKIITKWWKELDLASKLPFTFRDRNVEYYFGMMGIYFEPRYSLARILGTKISMIMTIVDDTYDAYATLPEALCFTDALQRWDIEAIESLPSYMQIILKNLWEIIKDIEQEMSSRGRYGGVQKTIDEIKSLTKGYMEIAKWARAGHVPSFEEYLEVGVITMGMDDMVIYSFLGMEDCDEKIMYEWFASKPKIFQAFNVVVRLTNDIETFEEELKRGEVANGVNCYMKQHGVSHEEAVKELRKMIKDHHEIMMDEFFNVSSTLPRQILMRVFNLARVIKLFYKDGDGFGHPDENLKAHFTSLFL
ncbi:Terpenoid cyclases/protein prenyltransferase alpha-alpha toroid [Arabidopsis thaliana x Arabidopsis arenosa]|uniref:Terpenoid cyclases/protein prenyltransferase alpha-alpha toroid n=1 Tax=Arabidopsis thaliana x Arabidopsis arenosa TaxID=1240361 RepID=A0A8T1XTH7_9BRAS|nr:Terpenoid cyclases/protein prenyltransferase alpha-alpha toroid [Arabidopsis thaliana x Arabidopsis arenosa]